MKVSLLVMMFGFASGGYIPEDRPDEGADISDIGLSPTELITKYKYPAEQHFVTTQDGYVLTVIRIPYGRTCSRMNNKGVIVLHHGLTVSCYNFILPGTKRGLAYILADMCYDVWMPNTRGNSLSIKHVNYSIDSYKYWDFSFHEVGLYDLPAVSDYVLEQTGERQYVYIGYSQGVTSFLAFGFLRPEYAHKHLFDSLKIYSILQRGGPLNRLLATLCPSVPPISIVVCELIFFDMLGNDVIGLNMTMFKFQILNHLHGGSVKQVAHLMQLLRSGRFQFYDYRSDNIRFYGQPKPPIYNLTKVAIPIHIYYAENDRASPVEGIQKMAKELPNVRELYLVPRKRFNHFGHVYANNIIELEYDHLVEQIDKVHGCCG